MQGFLHCVWPLRMPYSAAEKGEKKSRQAHRGSRPKYSRSTCEANKRWARGRNLLLNPWPMQLLLFLWFGSSWDPESVKCYCTLQHTENAVLLTFVIAVTIGTMLLITVSVWVPFPILPPPVLRFCRLHWTPGKHTNKDLFDTWFI